MFSIKGTYPGDIQRAKTYLKNLNCNVIINRRSYKGNILGYTWINSNGDIRVAYDPSHGISSMLALAHELIHAQQILDGRLTEKAMCDAASEAYEYCEFEIEAYRDMSKVMEGFNNV